MINRFGLRSRGNSDQKIKDLRTYIDLVIRDGSLERLTLLSMELTALTLDIKVHPCFIKELTRLENYVFNILVKKLDQQQNRYYRDSSYYRSSSRYSENQYVRHVDYFAILGLNSSATAQQVKSAYRRLALIHHPDQGGTETKFIELTKAKDECLKEIERR